MLQIIFTLDYEIHGNGDGCPHRLMVEPTDRMLRLFEEYGAKVTIMADIAEILKFQEYAQTHGRDEYFHGAICSQLQRAVRDGHDVQLHIHSSYFNAVHDGRGWIQDWSEYNFASLPPQRLNEYIARGKRFLESLLRPVKPTYQCIAFRAANWSAHPSQGVVQSLAENGIRIDTSVFKHGQRRGIVDFDYSQAPSEMVPWRVSEVDICQEDENSQVWEFPIYCEERWIGAFLTPNRVYRAWVGRRHRISGGAAGGADAPELKARIRAGRSPRMAWLQRHAWKADFNQCTGRQLVRALDRAWERHGHKPVDLPFVLIGHSKLFTRANESSLRPFLAHVANNGQRFRFGIFSDLDVDRLASHRP